MLPNKEINFWARFEIFGTNQTCLQLAPSIPVKQFTNRQMTLTLQTLHGYYDLHISQHLRKLMWSLQ